MCEPEIIVFDIKAILAYVYDDFTWIRWKLIFYIDLFSIKN
jgi:hypothetical protein